MALKRVRSDGEAVCCSSGFSNALIGDDPDPDKSSSSWCRANSDSGAVKRRRQGQNKIHTDSDDIPSARGGVWATESSYKLEKFKVCEDDDDPLDNRLFKHLVLRVGSIKEDSDAESNVSVNSSGAEIQQDRATGDGNVRQLDPRLFMASDKTESTDSENSELKHRRRKRFFSDFSETFHLDFADEGKMGHSGDKQQVKYPKEDGLMKRSRQKQSKGSVNKAKRKTTEDSGVGEDLI
ncbi:hypothetical protein BaRGS_00007234 [Batillaria attramentaria]|uniref:Uncharacterized protein n=1 Tax=Batillaria attramentaria TaxID=370345 RepID=A0ABD0LPN5_9CAEN